MAELKTFEGYVLFTTFNKQSKSEHLAPVLLIEQGVSYQLFKKGDNPFMYESLRPFHRKYCEVQGELDIEKNLLSVSNIQEKPDPISIWNDEKAGEDDSVTKINNNENTNE